jgi:hypothetical protein
MLINLSNHPSSKWSKKQLHAAQEEFTKVLDIPFPEVDPFADHKEIKILARMYAEKCMRYLEAPPFIDQKNALHIMGEMTFCFALISIFKSRSIRCVASTTIRNVSENKLAKTSKFEFVRFRDY